MLRRAASALYRVFALLLTVVLLVINARLYTGAKVDDVPAQLHFIRSALDAGAGSDMQGYFPEGYFFSHVLYGLAWVNVGLSDAGFREEALREARGSLAQLESNEGRAPFSPALNPPYGVFYNGWTNGLRGGILKLQPPNARDPDEVAAFEETAAALGTAFDASNTPFLQAYPGQAWPVDSTVAVASLRLHDTLFEALYSDTIQRWLASVKAHLDPATGLLPHRVDSETGGMLEGARASSQSVITRFLPEIDPVWGREQYRRFRDTFVTTVAGIPGVLEYPRGINGAGDVDSGPLLAGVSLSATVVTVAAARVEGDVDLYEPLLDVGEALGLPVTLGDSKRYAFGALPVGDAFLAWAKSAVPWTYVPAEANFPAVLPGWWRLPWHGVTVLLLALVWWPVVRWMRRYRR
jgi:hypothetical protein